MASKKKQPKTVDWLVMLYMAGDNNLEREMVQSLQFLPDIERGGNNAIVAEFDSNRPDFGTKRYDFSVKRKGNLLENYVVGELEEKSTGNPDTLTEFIEWSEGQYTAQHKILILSGHGSGATQDYLAKDENADDFLSIGELKLALEEAGYHSAEGGPKLDIIGMDACYMSMAEIGYELRGQVDILIGAEGLEPESGWPYSKILKRVGEERARLARVLEPEEVAITLVKEYVEHYSAFDLSVDLAAIRLSQMGDLKREFRSLVTKLNREGGSARKELIGAHWRAQGYKSDQFVDLKDLCDQIYDGHFGDPVKRSVEKITAWLKEAVIQSGCSGFAYQWSHGLSIYFPWAFVSPDYANMNFAKDTGWIDFIVDLVKATRRESRYRQTHHDDRITRCDYKPITPAMRTKLVDECTKACVARAKVVPFLISAQVKESGLCDGVEKRCKRIVDCLNDDGMTADHIQQDLRSEVSKIGRGSPRRTRGSPRRTKYMPITHYPADREMAVKNVAPVTGVAWWPMLPKDRMLQV
jgi:hypothetical protein